MNRFRSRRNPRWPTALSLVLLGPLAAVTLRSQERVAITPRPAPRNEQRPKGNIRLDVKLVLTPVTVTDLIGRPVTGLGKTNFRVFEDGVEQEMQSVSVADAPASVGVVFDDSRSMKNRLADSRAAVDKFLRTSSPKDEFLLVEFNDRARLSSSFTRDPAEISRLLASSEARGWTALVDAICLATQKMRRATNPRKALLVLSDGGDNNSRYSEGELLSLLREADVRVFAISLLSRPGYLEKISEETGGHAVWVRRMSDLDDAMEQLSREIRSEYQVGYVSPRDANDGRYHKVRVEVEPPPGSPPIRVSWRHGYLSPDE